MNEKARGRLRKVWPVALLLGVALAGRLALLLTLEGKPFIAEPILDSKMYDAWGQRIVNEDFWGSSVFYQDPLYPYFLGILYKVIGRSLLTIKILQALLGVLGLWFLFEGARRAAGYGVGIAALALGALYRTTLFYDVVLLKEFLGPFFIEAAFLTTVLAVEQRRWGWWFLTGLALGLGALVRGNLLIVAPILTVACLVHREWRGAAFVIAGAAIAILPCTVRNAVIGKEFVLTTAQLGPNLYTGNNPENWTGRYQPPSFVEAGSPEFEERDFAREAARRKGVVQLSRGEVSAYWRGEAWWAISTDPWSFIQATFRRVMLLVNDWEVPDNFNLSFMRRFSRVLWLPWLTFGVVVWPLAAAGLYLSWLERRKHLLAYALLAGSVLPVAIFFVFDRYRLPALPLLFFFGGMAGVRLYEMWRWHMRRVPTTALIVGGVAFVLSLVPPRVWGVGDTTFFVQHFNLAKWHLDHGEPASAYHEMERAFHLRAEARDDPRWASFAADCALEAAEEEASLELYSRVHNYAGKARCYRRLGDPAAAARELERAISVDPRDVRLRIERAEALEASRDWPKALDVLAKAIRDFPDEATLYVVQARVYRSLNMWGEAAKAALEALKRAPTSEEARRIYEEAKTK